MQRYVLHAEKEQMEKTFDVSSSSDSLFNPSYNIFPGTNSLIIQSDNNQRFIKSAKWGIADEKKNELSSILLDEADQFTNSFKDGALKPCLIPASGFYMWKQSISDSYPFYVRMLNREVLALAGYCKEFEDKNGRRVTEFAVLEKVSNVLLQPLEPNMPCILDSEYFEEWLKSENRNVLSSRFKEGELVPDLAVYRVPELVNDLSNNSAELIQPIPKLREDD